MGKTLRKIGLGLVLGGLASHYLSTEKGKKTVKELQHNFKFYQEHPTVAQSDLKAGLAQAVDYLKKAYEQGRQTDILQGEFTPIVEEDQAEETVTVSEFDDIIINYDEEA